MIKTSDLKTDQTWATSHGYRWIRRIEDGWVRYTTQNGNSGRAWATTFVSWINNSSAKLVG